MKYLIWNKHILFDWGVLSQNSTGNWHHFYGRTHNDFNPFENICGIGFKFSPSRAENDQLFKTTTNKLRICTVTLPETNIAHENPIFPGKYHQNDGFSMAMLVYRSVNKIQGPLLDDHTSVKGVGIPLIVVGPCWKLHNLVDHELARLAVQGCQ